MPFTLLLLAAFAASTPATAQVSGRQGTAPPPDVVHYASPMILELPLPNVAELEPRSQVALSKDTRKHICDQHVSLINLWVARELKGRGEARAPQVVVSGLISVVDSYDRLVDLTFHLKRGEELLAKAMARNVSAEEERNTPFRVSLPLTESALREAFGAEPRPILEVTLSVRDNS